MFNGSRSTINLRLCAFWDLLLLFFSHSDSGYECLAIFVELGAHVTLFFHTAVSASSESYPHVTKTKLSSSALLYSVRHAHGVYCEQRLSLVWLFHKREELPDRESLGQFFRLLNVLVVAVLLGLSCLFPFLKCFRCFVCRKGLFVVLRYLHCTLLWWQGFRPSLSAVRSVGQECCILPPASGNRLLLLSFPLFAHPSLFPWLLERSDNVVLTSYARTIYLMASDGLVLKRTSYRLASRLLPLSLSCPSPHPLSYSGT